MTTDAKTLWKAALRHAPEGDPARRRALTTQLINNLEHAKDLAGLPMSRTRQMLSDGADGVQVVRHLMNHYFYEASDGFRDLQRAGLLELSFESTMLDERFSDLFLESELSWARERLDSFGYRPQRRRRRGRT